MQRIAAVLVIVLVGLLAQAVDADPSVYLKLQINGNDTPGESSVASLGRADTIPCLSFEMGVTSPRDVSGKQTGHRSYQPVIITKEICKASLPLIKALTRNEVCDCEFMIYGHDAQGVEHHRYTIRLQNAYVAAVRQYVAEAAPAGSPLAPMIEEAEFVFQDITWTWMDGGIEHSDAVRASEASGGAAATPAPPPVTRPRIIPRLTPRRNQAQPDE